MFAGERGLERKLRVNNMNNEQLHLLMNNYTYRLEI